MCLHLPLWAQYRARAKQGRVSNGCSHKCPLPLLPVFENNEVRWPDVCHCPVNGGVSFDTHKLQVTCVGGVENTEDQVHMVVGGIEQPPLTWVCTCPEVSDAAGWLKGEAGTSGHLPNCPFDHCPVGTCHPMCAQVTGSTHVIGHESGEALFCHCACHG